MKFKCTCPDMKNCPNQLSVSESAFFDGYLTFRVKGKGVLLGKRQLKALIKYLRKHAH